MRRFPSFEIGIRILRTLVMPVLGRWTTLGPSVGALSRPTFGFHARLQVPLARTRAVGPRVLTGARPIRPCRTGFVHFGTLSEYALGH